jgi:hypothetical protein
MIFVRHTVRRSILTIVWVSKCVSASFVNCYTTVPSKFEIFEEFNFKEGDPYNNFTIKVEDEYSRYGDDTSFEIEVLKVYLNSVGQIVILAKDSMSNIDEVEDMRELVRLYEKLYEIANK